MTEKNYDLLTKFVSWLFLVLVALGMRDLIHGIHHVNIVEWIIYVISALLLGMIWFILFIIVMVINTDGGTM